MTELIKEIRLNKKQLDRIIAVLKGLIERIQRGEEEVARCEKILGVTAKEFRKMIREMKQAKKRRTSDRQETQPS